MPLLPSPLCLSCDGVMHTGWHCEAVSPPAALGARSDHNLLASICVRELNNSFSELALWLQIPAPGPAGMLLLRKISVLGALCPATWGEEQAGWEGWWGAVASSPLALGQQLRQLFLG